MFKQGDIASKVPGIRINVLLKPIPLLFMIPTGIFIATRLNNLATYSLWGGELFSLTGALLPWSDMFSYVIADIVHPPLFYILLKIWVVIGGESLLWLKLLPALLGIAIIFPFLLLCRELKLKPIETGLALIFLSVNGYLIHYAQELRMYILFMFLSTCSYWLFLKFYNAERNYIKILLVLFVTNLLLIYSHYYGWLVVGVQFVFLLFFRRQKLPVFSISVAGLLVGFSPWGYLVIRETISRGGLETNLDWIPRPGLYELRHFYGNLNGQLGFRRNMELGLLVFGSPILFWAWHAFLVKSEGRKDDKNAFWYLSMLAFLPVVLIFITSQFLPQAAWTQRYFVFTAIPYLILVAMSVQRLPTNWLRTSVMFLLMIWSILAGSRDLITNRMAWESPQLGSRIEWDNLIKALIKAERSQDNNTKIYALPVLSNRIRTGDWAITSTMPYYLSSFKETRFQIEYAWKVSSIISDSQEDHFWVAFFDLEANRGFKPQKELLVNGFKVGEEIQEGKLNNRLVLFPVWR